MMNPNLPEQSDEIVERIRPLLANKDPALQGMVLADLLAVWVAGHRCEAGQVETNQLRCAMMSEHLQCVARLTALYDAQVNDAVGQEQRSH